MNSAAAQSKLVTVVPPSELQLLHNVATRLVVPAGTQVTRQSEAGRQCVVVLDGHLAVERDGQFVSTIGPGTFAGEMSMVLGQRCNADVIASEESVVYVMNRSEFRSLVNRCPTLNSEVLTTAVNRLGSLSSVPPV